MPLQLGPKPCYERNMRGMRDYGVVVEEGDGRDVRGTFTTSSMSRTTVFTSALMTLRLQPAMRVY